MTYNSAMNSEAVNKKQVIALEVAALISGLSPFIERHTAEVCPSCRDVCCADRHSRYDRSDLIYFASLDLHMPTAPDHPDGLSRCRFMAECGCSLERFMRPYRCTWFFCAPLLDHIERQAGVREYRKFLSDLARITEKRTNLIETFEAS